MYTKETEIYLKMDNLLKMLVKQTKKNLENLEMSNITLAELDIIMIIGDSDSKSIKEIIRELDIANSTPTRTIARLAEKGVLIRQPDESDRRIVLLQLTEKGISIYNKLSEMRQQQISDLLNSLTEVEKVAFDTLISKINKNIT